MMKSFIIVICLVIEISSSQSVPPTKSSQNHGIILKGVFLEFLEFLAENSDNVAACESGFKLEASGDYWQCVDATEKKDETEEVIAPDCPEAIHCPKSTNCKKGFHLLVHDSKCCCVKQDIAQSSSTSSETTEPVLVSNCPTAQVCPKNPSCSKGYHLLNHADVCCCVKEDVFVDEENDKDDGLIDPKICPFCSLTDPAGDVDCDCIMPMRKIDWLFDSVLKFCCEQT
jgi:hypothetical protein